MSSATRREASFAAVIERMRVEDRIEAVILGGTELPMLFRDAAPTSLPLLGYDVDPCRRRDRPAPPLDT